MHVCNMFALLLLAPCGQGKGEGIAEHLFTSVLNCIPWCILFVIYVYMQLYIHKYKYIHVCIYIYIYMHHVYQLFALLLLALSRGVLGGGMAEHLCTSVLTCMPCYLASATHTYKYIYIYNYTNI